MTEQIIYISGLQKHGVQISMIAARKNAKLTLIDAAKRIGIGKDTLFKWEHNSALVNPLYQAKISDAYSMPIDCIYFG